MEELLIYIVPVIAFVIILVALMVKRRRSRQYLQPPVPSKSLSSASVEETISGSGVLEEPNTMPPVPSEDSLPVSVEETISGSGVVEAPNPMKPSVTYPVMVHVVGEELPLGIEVNEGLFKETIGFEMVARGSPIIIFSHSDAFNISPLERKVPVPRKGEKSTTTFYVSPKTSYTGIQKLFFEFHQGDQFLGLANTDLEISTITETEKKLVVTLSFSMRIHV